MQGDTASENSATLRSGYASGRTANSTEVTCRKRETFAVASIAYNGKEFDGVSDHGATRLSWSMPVRSRTAFTPPLSVTSNPSEKPPHAHPPAGQKRSERPRHIGSAELLVDVEYRALTEEGKVRQPSFKGVRRLADTPSTPSQRCERTFAHIRYTGSHA
jgi:hypothetical protein